MSDNLNMEISIPSDSDGFILLQCPLCSEYFKLTAQDINAEDVLGIWCPNCGMRSENYLSEEIIKLATVMCKNKVEDMLYREMKKLEQKTRGKFITFKTGRKPTPEYEAPVVPGIDALDIENYICCKKQAKISPSVKLVGGYCPFCGVNHDECK